MASPRDYNVMVALFTVWQRIQGKINFKISATKKRIIFRGNGHCLHNLICRGCVTTYCFDTNCKAI